MPAIQEIFAGDAAYNVSPFVISRDKRTWLDTQALLAVQPKEDLVKLWHQAVDCISGSPSADSAAGSPIGDKRTAAVLNLMIPRVLHHMYPANELKLGDLVAKLVGATGMSDNAENIRAGVDSFIQQTKAPGLQSEDGLRDALQAKIDLEFSERRDSARDTMESIMIEFARIGFADGTMVAEGTSKLESFLSQNTEW